jgi:hypothetical protein
MSEDGQYFRKAGRFEFEESALFSAVMVKFVTNPQEAVRMLENIIPTELFEKVKNANEQQLSAAKSEKTEDLAAENERLRAMIEESQSGNTQ